VHVVLDRVARRILRASEELADVQTGRSRGRRTRGDHLGPASCRPARASRPDARGRRPAAAGLTPRPLRARARSPRRPRSLSVNAIGARIVARCSDHTRPHGRRNLADRRPCPRRGDRQSTGCPSRRAPFTIASNPRSWHFASSAVARSSASRRAFSASSGTPRVVASAECRRGLLRRAGTVTRRMTSFARVRCRLPVVPPPLGAQLRLPYSTALVMVLPPIDSDLLYSFSGLLGQAVCDRLDVLASCPWSPPGLTPSLTARISWVLRAPLARELARIARVSASEGFWCCRLFVPPSTRSRPHRLAHVLLYVSCVGERTRRDVWQWVRTSTSPLLRVASVTPPPRGGAPRALRDLHSEFYAYANKNG